MTLYDFRKMIQEFQRTGALTMLNLPSQQSTGRKSATSLLMLENTMLTRQDRSIAQLDSGSKRRSSTIRAAQPIVKAS
jgi:hypothetical protein